MKWIGRLRDACAWLLVFLLLGAIMWARLAAVGVVGAP